jgi:hypothetical protein
MRAPRSLRLCIGNGVLEFVVKLSCARRPKPYSQNHKPVVSQ